MGADREHLERGDVLGAPGAWRAVPAFDAWLAPVRGLDRVPARGAFKVYAGAAEADATIHQAGDGFARVRLQRPLVLQPGDRFVVRDAGRRATVGGGEVLDVGPPRRFAQPAHLAALARRRHATPAQVAAVVIEERGAVPIEEVPLLAGAPAPEDRRVGAWAVDERVRDAVARDLTALLEAYHRDHPLEEGAPLGVVREEALVSLRRVRAPADAGLADALLAAQPDAVRTATTLRLATHRVALEARGEDLAGLLAAIGGDAEATPPTVKELVAAGVPADVIDAAARAGEVVRLAPDLVVTRAFADRGLALVRDHAEDGVTVSALREHLGTSRKYAVPLAEWMDAQGLTRRRGDLRFPRDP